MINRIFVSVYDSWDTYCTGLKRANDRDLERWHGEIKKSYKLINKQLKYNNIILIGGLNVFNEFPNQRQYHKTWTGWLMTDFEACENNIF